MQRHGQLEGHAPVSAPLVHGLILTYHPDASYFLRGRVGSAEQLVQWDLMAASDWLILGFSSDDVVMAWQDTRLAEACARAWKAAGKPDDFDVRHGPGDGDYLTHWFVSPAAAAVLDEQAVDWRRFVIGTRAAPPEGAARAIETSES